MVKVLVVGQTPPPFNGQTIAIQLMLNGRYKKIKVYHVRMAFSKELNEIGKFNFRKLYHLITTIYSIIFLRFRYKIPILYYPPSGSARIPMFRDFMVLIPTRWLFKRTVFHFHSAGISELYGRISILERFLFRKAYYNAEFVDFLGLCTGDRKWKAYSDADIFTFPSFYENEALPLVVIEAIQFGLPVVTTRWRGIPFMVENGESGFLVPIKDSIALAEKIAVLLTDSKMREEMGKRARNIYLERFTIQKFWHNMEEAFLSTA